LQKLDEFNLPMVAQPQSHDDRHMSDEENE
jgi:hypothetical protein